MTSDRRPKHAGTLDELMTGVRLEPTLVQYFRMRALELAINMANPDDAIDELALLEQANTLLEYMLGGKIKEKE